MREILFRGISTDNGSWVQGTGFYINAEHTFAFIVVDGGYDQGHRAYVIPETVGQYTELKDKNGNKIFEGDIVTFTLEIEDGTKTYTDEVIFSEGQFSLKEDYTPLYAFAEDCEITSTNINT